MAGFLLARTDRSYFPDGIRSMDAVRVDNPDRPPRIGVPGPSCNVLSNPFANCSFESGGGSFSGWIVKDVVSPFYPLKIGVTGEHPLDPQFFPTMPTQGAFAAIHGFDALSGAPETIEIS